MSQADPTTTTSPPSKEDPSSGSGKTGSGASPTTTETTKKGKKWIVKAGKQLLHVTGYFVYGEICWEAVRQYWKWFVGVRSPCPTTRRFHIHWVGEVNLEGVGKTLGELGLPNLPHVEVLRRPKAAFVYQFKQEAPRAFVWGGDLHGIIDQFSMEMTKQMQKEVWEDWQETLCKLSMQ